MKKYYNDDKEKILNFFNDKLLYQYERIKRLGKIVEAILKN